MGKTRSTTSLGTTNRRRLRSAAKPVPTIPEKVPQVRRKITAEISTQTSSSVPGTFEDFREKIANLHSSISAVIRRLEPDSGEKDSRESNDMIVGCPTCFLPFLRPSRSPVCLPCGHSICEQCIPLHRSRTNLTCPLDYKTFPYAGLPTNFLLLQAVEALCPPENLLCREHQCEAIGYCEDEEVVICGVCLFLHKEHNCCMLESERADALAEERMSEYQQACETAGCQVKQWNAQLSSLSELWQNLALTPTAMSMNLMFYGQSFAEGSDQHFLMLVSEDLNSLLCSVRRLLDALDEKQGEYQRVFTAFREFTVGQRLALQRPSVPQLPRTEELFACYYSLVGRLSYSTQFLMT